MHALCTYQVLHKLVIHNKFLTIPLMSIRTNCVCLQIIRIPLNTYIRLSHQTKVYQLDIGIFIKQEIFLLRMHAQTKIHQTSIHQQSSIKLDVAM